MDELISEVQETKYVIKVHGKIVSVPFISHQLAEAQVAQLSIDQQPFAEIVQITSDGKELLFG